MMTLGLLGAPSVEGIRDHVQGFRRRARLLEQQLHEEREATGASPDFRVPRDAASSSSGLQGPSLVLAELTCRERSDLRLDADEGQLNKVLHALAGRSPVPEVREGKGDSERQSDPKKVEEKAKSPKKVEEKAKSPKKASSSSNKASKESSEKKTSSSSS